MLKFISVLYTTGCRGGELDVCDVIFEEGPRKCDEGGEREKSFLKIT